MIDENPLTIQRLNVKFDHLMNYVIEQIDGINVVRKDIEEIKATMKKVDKLLVLVEKLVAQIPDPSVEPSVESNRYTWEKRVRHVIFDDDNDVDDDDVESSSDGGNNYLGGKGVGFPGDQFPDDVEECDNCGGENCKAEGECCNANYDF